MHGNDWFHWFESARDLSEELLKVLKNKKHPQHKELKTWIGEKYDPEFIDLTKINEELKNIENYIKMFEKEGGFDS
jgi:hypothetical protein